MKINEVMAKYKSRDIKLTYEDYLTLPDDGNKYEILEGEIIMTPAPSIKHQTILRNLFLLIHSYVEEQKMGQVFFAPVDVILSDHTVLEPDLLFVANENRNLIKERGIFGPPDLCAEIISKSTAYYDLNDKKMLFAKHGVKEYWLVDQYRETMDIFSAAKDGFTLHGQLIRGESATSALLSDLQIQWDGVFSGI
jgi:Uma2 family endonuclease